MSSGLRRSWGQRAVLTVNSVGIAAALLVAFALDAGVDVTSSINRVELSGSLTPAEPDGDGELSAINVLLVGYDSAANLDPDDPVAIGRQGERLGDVIIIARVDRAAETATMLSIPRDLWVPIPGHSDNKINAAFQLGGAGLLIDTIEANLDIPINSFVSVDLAGFAGLVDVVDHVDLFFEYPSRDFNPSPPSGPPRSMSGFAVSGTECQSLGPDMALAFVRSRNFQILVDGDWIDDGQRSDLERIRRQQLFVESFLARAIDLGARNPLVLRELVTAAVPHLTLDQELTPQTLLDLGRSFDSFDADELVSFSLPTEFGEEGNGTISVVRMLEDEAAPVLQLMLGASPDDPSTVGIALASTDDQRDSADALVDVLEAAGFDIDVPGAGSGLDSGVTVRFGRDGDQARELVVDRLAAAGVTVDRTVADDSLPGREIVVEIGPDPIDAGGAQTAEVDDDETEVDGTDAAPSATTTPATPDVPSVGVEEATDPADLASVRACP